MRQHIATAFRQAWAETKARRAVAAAMAMAEDRRAMEGSRFALTVTGLLALREAEG